ncbi:hypothetical protein MMC12_008534 [Toensbergia leucococca]|nr:hypothetical protein [Toensbergia leucococca]
MLYSISRTTIFLTLLFTASLSASLALDPRADTESSSPSINLAILDPNGNDVSDKVSVSFNIHNISSANSLQKRAAHAITRICPPGFTFGGSLCRAFTSPQAYVALCAVYFPRTRTVGDSDAELGQCPRDQICVNGVPPPGPIVHPYQAFCVDRVASFKIAQSISAGTFPGTVTEGLNIGGSNSYALGAILTGLDGTTSIFAETLSIQTQTYQMIGNVPVWGSLPNGTDECHNCPSVDIHPIPVGTKRVVVNVVLQAATAAALMYLEAVVS